MNFEVCNFDQDLHKANPITSDNPRYGPGQTSFQIRASSLSINYSMNRSGTTSSIMVADAYVILAPPVDKGASERVYHSYCP
ncbi:hypothetical protein RRG08_055056 [Elysia crispata]|uniref:Uncharacterized protein n=1 Tax=Elysia crispata TaxID=231223 RepID=A0AAE1AZG4_9GAST|nr:hypothetical protein RRG08_055056 [Elysia crispata]